MESDSQTRRVENIMVIAVAGGREKWGSEGQRVQSFSVQDK